MKSKWLLIGSIFQLVIGFLAIVSFVILSTSGENMARWIVTVILAIFYVILGIIGIIDYKNN